MVAQTPTVQKAADALPSGWRLNCIHRRPVRAAGFGNVWLALVLSPSMRTTARAVTHGRSPKVPRTNGLLGTTSGRRGCCTLVLHASELGPSGVTGRPPA